MAAKSLGDFIETYKREHGCNPGITETWYAAIEFAEANKPSRNISMDAICPQHDRDCSLSRTVIYCTSKVGCARFERAGY